MQGGSETGLRMPTVDRLKFDLTPRKIIIGNRATTGEIRHHRRKSHPIVVLCPVESDAK